MSCGCHDQACSEHGVSMHGLIKPILQRRQGVALIIGDGDRHAVMMSIFNHMTDHGKLGEESISIVAKPGLYDVSSSYLSPCGRGGRMLTDALHYALMSDKDDILLDLDGSTTLEPLRKAILASLAGHRIWVSVNCDGELSAAELLGTIDIPAYVYGDTLLGLLLVRSDITVKGIDDLVGIVEKLNKTGDGS